MKKIVLALILGLGATIARADDYDVIDDVFRSTDPLAQRDEYGLPSGPPCERYRLRAEISLAMVLLFQGPRTTDCATGLCGFDANGVASAGLLLWPHRRRVFSGSSQCDRASSKELFIARHGHIYRFRAMGTAFALNCLNEIGRQSTAD